MLSEWSAECSHDAPTLVVPWSEDPSDPSGGAHFIDLRADPYDIAEIPEAELYPPLGRALRSLNATRSPFLTAKCDAWATPSAATERASAKTPGAASGAASEAASDFASEAASEFPSRAAPDAASDVASPTASEAASPAASDAAIPIEALHLEALRLEGLRQELMLSAEEAGFSFASYIDLLWRERSVFASAHQQQDRLDRIVRRAQRLPHPEAALQCVLRPALLDLNGPLEGFAFTLYVTALGPEREIARRRWELALDDIVSLLRSRELESSRGSATIDATDAYPLRVRHLG